MPISTEPRFHTLLRYLAAGKYSEFRYTPDRYDLCTLAEAMGLEIDVHSDGEFRIALLRKNPSAEFRSGTWFMLVQWGLDANGYDKFEEAARAIFDFAKRLLVEFKPEMEAIRARSS